MKTKFLTIATIFTLAVGTATTTFASAKNNDGAGIILTDVSRINKIEIRGNVELFVSDGTADQVKVYNKYYKESALVQSRDGILRITSYAPQKLVVWVTANDLRAITAYDKAEVKSFGSLSKIELDVNLYNSASAQLNLEAYRANISVNDNAKATLTGTVNDYNLKYALPANINAKDFAAANSTTTLLGSPDATIKGVQLAGL